MFPSRGPWLLLLLLLLLCSACSFSRCPALFEFPSPSGSWETGKVFQLGMPDTLTKDDNVASNDIDEFMLISLDAMPWSPEPWALDVCPSGFGPEGCSAISWQTGAWQINLIVGHDEITQTAPLTYGRKGWLRLPISSGSGAAAYNKGPNMWVTITTICHASLRNSLQNCHLVLILRIPFTFSNQFV